MIRLMKHVNILLFADDCVIYLSGNNWENIHRKIQIDFDAIIEWTLRNNLRLNHNKTKAMIFSTRHRALRLDKLTPFKLLGNEIKFVNAHINLGITLDVAMTLNRLLKSVNKQVTNKIFTLLKIRKFITKDVAILIYDLMTEYRIPSIRQRRDEQLLAFMYSISRNPEYTKDSKCATLLRWRTRANG